MPRDRDQSQGRDHPRREPQAQPAADPDVRRETLPAPQSAPISPDRAAKAKTHWSVSRNAIRLPSATGTAVEVLGSIPPGMKSLSPPSIASRPIRTRCWTAACPERMQWDKRVGKVHIKEIKWQQNMANNG